jgi:hypothetical protein
MGIASSTVQKPVTDLVAPQVLTPSTVPVWSIVMHGSNPCIRILDHREHSCM